MPENWKADASCRGLPAEIFFPEREEGINNHGHEGKEVCADCPVRAECLDHSVRVDYEKHGIWGGVSGGRRAALRQIWRAGDVQAYRRALIAETAELGRSVAGYEDDREPTPERQCERCDSVVPAGVHPEDRNSSAASCGLAATYNRGCRCAACTEAKKAYYAESKNRKRSPRGESATVNSPRPQQQPKKRRTAR